MSVPQCDECSTELPGTNGDLCRCGGLFCREHIARVKHDCSSLKTESTVSQKNNSGSGNLIAGAILLATGVLLTVTAVGAVFGIPLAMLGFAVMFPRFSAAMVVLAVISLVYLL